MFFAWNLNSNRWFQSAPSFAEATEGSAPRPAPLPRQRLLLKDLALVRRNGHDETRCHGRIP